MHRRLLIRCAAAAMLVALATSLGIDRGAPGTPIAPPPVSARAAAPDAGKEAAGSAPAAEAAPDASSPGPSAKVACEPERPARARPPTLPEDPGELLEPPDQLEDLERALATLAQSSDPEHLLAVAAWRWRDDPASSLRLMARALALDPDNTLIALDLAELCLEQPQAAECAGRDPEREILRIAGSNGSVWARIAERRYRNGDRAGALEAMRRAAVAPGFDDYWIEHTLLFERALAASTGYTYAERIQVAFGLPNPAFGQPMSMIDFCREQGASSAEWRRACADLGARMEADAGTVFGIVIGQALQGQAFEAAGDEAAVERLRQRNRETLELLRESGPGEELLQGDPAVLQQFMAELDTYGELAAYRYLKEAMERRAAEDCAEND